MKVLVSRLLYHWRIFQQLVGLGVKQLLEYHLNIFIHTIYAFVYLCGTYFIYRLIFANTQTLAGFDQVEIGLMILTSLLMWVWMEVFKVFMGESIVTGELDLILTKPVNTVFFIAFSKPAIAAVSYASTLTLLFIGFLFANLSYISFLSLFSFLMIFSLCMLICFQVFSIYATSGFVIYRSNQMLRALQGVSDHSQYPTVIYPRALQFVFFSIVPLAFMGYIPSVFLLGKGTWHLLLLVVTALTISTIFSSFIWRKVLRSYASASS